MAKTAGLGDNFYVGGYDLSGDVNALSSIHGGPAPLDVTVINQSAFSRLGGLRDAGMDFTVFMDPAAGQAHTALSALPRTDTIATYCRGTTLGNPAACMNAKQVNYDPTRGADGSLTLAVNTIPNSFGLEWGVQQTAGLLTQAGAGTTASLNNGASTAFGGQAYLQLTAFNGSSITVAVQDSADNNNYSNVTNLVFSAASTAPTFQRVATAAGATLRQYTRINTTGTFSSATFNVVTIRNTLAVSF